MTESGERDTLPAMIVAGVVVGTAGGLAASGLWGGSRGLDVILTNIVAPVGQIFLRFLLMVVVPLVFTTLVLGIAGLDDLKQVGHLGARTLMLFVATTTLAASLGLLVANTIRPGDTMSPETRATLVETFAPRASDVVNAARQPVGVGTIVDMVPRNPVTAAADGNLMAFIFFTIVFGIAVTRLSEQHARPLLMFLDGVARTIMVIIGFAMRMAPVGVAALAFSVTARMGLSVLAPLTLYFVAVLGGLVVYQFGVLGLLARVAGMPAAEFYRGARLPMITAFSTASSSATLPTTLRAAEDELRVPKTVSGFVLPLGATLHMNGTAFFAAATIVFLSQAFGIPIPLSTQLTIVPLTVLIAISAAGVPSGAIPLIVVMLESFGIPGESIAVIFGVEPILGMMRTSTNVTGDLVASLVIARFRE